MQKIDRKMFFDGYRDAYGSLTQVQVDGLESLLSCLEADENVADLRYAAYMLATAKWETGQSFQPIKEYSRGKGRKYGVPHPKTGQIYFGRGLVQLTWDYNYQAMGRVFNLDLMNNPNLALEPDVAYKIMSYGMRHGSFTGVGLKRYIFNDCCDYVNARRVINGLDQADRIAAYAEKLEEILREAIA